MDSESTHRSVLLGIAQLDDGPKSTMQIWRMPFVLYEMEERITSDRRSVIHSCWQLSLYIFRATPAASWSTPLGVRMRSTCSDPTHPVSPAGPEKRPTPDLAYGREIKRWKTEGIYVARASGLCAIRVPNLICKKSSAMTSSIPFKFEKSS